MHRKQQGRVSRLRGLVADVHEILSEQFGRENIVFSAGNINGGQKRVKITTANGSFVSVKVQEPGQGREMLVTAHNQQQTIVTVARQLRDRGIAICFK